MIDRTTKVTLIAIAAALWLHLVSPLWEPTPAHAQLGSSAEADISNMRFSLSTIQSSMFSIQSSLSSIESGVSSIQSDVSSVGYGLCLNDKLC